MNNPVRAIVIMIKVMIAIAILLIIAGFKILLVVNPEGGVIEIQR